METEGRQQSDTNDAKRTAEILEHGPGKLRWRWASRIVIEDGPLWGQFSWCHYERCDGRGVRKLGGVKHKSRSGGAYYACRGRRIIGSAMNLEGAKRLVEQAVTS
ncbi:MAG: hypothetical protein WCD12_20625 [Candidatus Binatus sp.]|uniref:hypothetical protein n=1 Tax=Candidatus Binatus sp. TaxID=2811406 RepID=UPI003C73B70A